MQRLIDMLYNMIDEAKSAAFSAEKCTINRDEALDILDEMRSKLPLELKGSNSARAGSSSVSSSGSMPWLIRAICISESKSVIFRTPLTMMWAFFWRA